MFPLKVIIVQTVTPTVNQGQTTLATHLEKGYVMKASHDGLNGCNTKFLPF